MGSAVQEEAARRNIIDITDLHHPVLTDVQKQVIAGAEAAADQIVLKPEVILAAAQAQTGLSDFGADDFRERLAVWCQAVDEDANASAVTRANLFQMMIRFAATRLRIEDMVKRHPEILDIQIDRPIICCRPIAASARCPGGKRSRRFPPRTKPRRTRTAIRAGPKRNRAGG